MAQLTGHEGPDDHRPAVLPAGMATIDLFVIGMATIDLFVIDDRRGTTDRVGGIPGLPPEEIAGHPHVLIGSVDTICEDLLERRERCGISYITGGVNAIDPCGPLSGSEAGEPAPLVR